MHIKRSAAVLIAILAVVTSQAQIRITMAERLPVPAGSRWTMPLFNQQGNKVYFSDENYDGIWEYSDATKAIRRITDDPRSGFGFALSPDGKKIAYRKTVDEGLADRMQSVIQLDLNSGSAVELESGNDVALPVYRGRSSLTSDASGPQFASAGAEPVMLGIEKTKIAMLVGGRKVILDPIGDGSYIWASLSPDKQKIVAYEMARGTFICDIRGNGVMNLGRCDSPAWTRDGKWIVYMDDKDDGRRIISSDLMAVAVDGTVRVQLTSTADIMEMHPKCSPTDDRIVCSTAAGELYILTYEVAR